MMTNSSVCYTVQQQKRLSELCMQLSNEMPATSLVAAVRKVKGYYDERM